MQTALRVRRFRCRNAACARRTFAERRPALIAAPARRTRRLATAPSAIAVAPGGEAGARLLPTLAMPASADTLLRLVCAQPLAVAPAPAALGVDDRSCKRASTCGTILVDLETRCAVDLLPDRRAETLAAWRRPRRRVKVVARDRSTEFAHGVEMGAPRTVQVADRWHLLKNVREMLTRWLLGGCARWRRLPAAPWSPARRAESFPERAVRAPGPGRLDRFIPWLEERLAVGCENASALCRELRARRCRRQPAGPQVGTHPAQNKGLARARTCGAHALQTFAAGVRHDLAAVKAALATGWSSGQTEGHVNKLPLLKRQRYGRARFDLLRRRLLLAS